MNPDDRNDDRDLRELFDRTRRHDQRHAPAFRAVLARRDAGHSATVGRPLLITGLAAALTVTLAWAFWVVGTGQDEPVVIAQNTPSVAEPEPELPIVEATPEPKMKVAASEEPRLRLLPPPLLPTLATPTAVPAAREVGAVDFAQDLPLPGSTYENVLMLALGVQDADGDGDPNIHESGDRGFNTEGYRSIEGNDFVAVEGNPLSTFSIDVDTASYSNVRRFLTQGRTPPPDAVRIEELINYFDYDYPQPAGDAPFSATVEISDCPWQPAHRLARIGIRGRAITRAESAGSNLVFLLDVSGSMGLPDRLPLLKTAFTLLVEQLTSNDRVAIVVYAGASGLALPSTSGDDKTAIIDALSRLRAHGRTNGGEGLRLAYDVARENFIPGGINRVILATDGDFNLGTTSHGELLDLIERDAKNGIFLTALGFGEGNLQDDRLEHLADRGNGHYAYIDRLKEARKVLVEELSGTLFTIAKDVKIQVEFNPLQVGAYRLIGYENRMLKKEDFNDDTKDAGEIGAGHTVTALYELAPPDAGTDSPAVDPLKYQSPGSPTKEADGGELLTLKLRYKTPHGDNSHPLSLPVSDDGLGLAVATDDFRFAAAVAQFGMLLRDSEYRGTSSFESVEQLATDARGADAQGYRAEFIELVRVAGALTATAESGE